MSSSALSGICDSLAHSLRPFTVSKPILLTKENEKNLLLHLSQISRQIRRRLNEFEPGIKQEVVVNTAPDGECFLSSEPHSSASHNCLNSIISFLVFPLTSESQFVRHSAGNVLLVLSDFLVKSGSEWEEFLHFLWVALEAAVSNSLSTGFLLDCNVPSFDSLLRSRMVRATWFTVTELLRVLRNVLKSLKRDDSDLANLYMRAGNVSLSNANWDWLSETHVGYAYRSSEILPCGIIGSTELQSAVVLGILLQLFSSLVDKIGPDEGKDFSTDELCILTRITCFVPKLLSWSLSKHQNYENLCISQYMRHKIMMLMTRLSFCRDWQCSSLLLWLELLWKYFEDILCEPVSAFHSGVHDFLDESPFLASMEDSEQLHNLSTRHLRRQSIFLLFKCSFSLICLNEETSRKCACSAGNSCLTNKQHSDTEICSQKGLSALAKWLYRYMPPEMFVDRETYLEECNRFALSFLQLYIDEDDFLFEMLLLLLSSPLPTEPLHYNGSVKTFEEAKEDIHLHFSCIFNPVHLFHMFLAELHYDHSILLDYLISNDTGIQCLKYLLRCLRIVCTSWHVFVEFSMHGGEIDRLYHKKRKVYHNEYSSFGNAEQSSSPMEAADNSKALERQNMRRKPTIDYIPKATRQYTFENAKKCLLSFKKSVDNLHQKGLFPYNPAPLLRSLTRFENLCRQKQKDWLQKPRSES